MFLDDMLYHAIHRPSVHCQDQLIKFRDPWSVKTHLPRAQIKMGDRVQKETGSEALPCLALHSPAWPGECQLLFDSGQDLKVGVRMSGTRWLEVKDSYGVKDTQTLIFLTHNRRTKHSKQQNKFRSIDRCTTYKSS